MTSPAIEAFDLSKKFRVSRPGASWSERFKRLFSPSYTEVPAVDGVSLRIDRGERVAFIGPNGAGKSTTIKMLTGIFHPTSGSVRVLGLDPIKDRKQMAYRIGTVFGQRSQLWYHLPPVTSFRLIAAMYDIPEPRYRQRVEELASTFSIEKLLDRPVREMSLGERMRCELASTLLHEPDILFLDEPTIGLDLVSKSAIRQFILDCSTTKGTTIFLTSHDIADIETVCDRVIIIDRGTVMVDAKVEELRHHHLQYRVIKLTAPKQSPWVLPSGLIHKSCKERRHTFELDLKQLSAGKAVELLLKQASIEDLTIDSPPLEDLIHRIYVDGHEAMK